MHFELDLGVGDVEDGCPIVLRVKAIIVAAGLGSRLKALTADRPKCFLEINGYSTFERQLKAFRAAGIFDISVVTGYRAQHFSDYPDVKLYHNDDFENNNVVSSLMYARPELNSELVISYGDIVFEEHLIQTILPVASDFTVIADKDWRKTYVGRTDHPETEAEKIAISGNSVHSIGKHLRSQETDAEFIGMLTLSKHACAIWANVFDELKADFSGRPFHHAATFEKASMTDMLQELINRGHEIRPLFINDSWMEIDTHQDYIAANRRFSESEGVRRNVQH